MITLPVMTSGDPSQVSASRCSFIKVMLIEFCFFHSSTTSSLIMEIPAPVSMRMGMLLCLSISSQIHTLFLVMQIFAVCLCLATCWAVLHEHTLTVLMAILIVWVFCVGDGYPIVPVWV